MSYTYAKLHSCAVGMAFGILAAVMMFFFGVLAMWEYGVAYVNLASSIYIGYGPTLLGAVLGAAWGFVEGFIMGYVFAWLYNRISDKCSKGGSDS